MTVRKIPPSVGESYEGLSTDAKPTVVVINSTFREIDTGIWYLTPNGTDWYAQNKIIRPFTHHLVGGNLTEEGIQWSAEVSTVDADTDYIVLELTMDNGQVGRLHELDLGLTLAIKAGSATADVKYKWQARNKDGTWVDLHDYITKVDIGTSYIECAVSGYRIEGITNLDKYPIDVRLVIQSNETTPGVATAKVKNSSYVKVEVK